MGLFALNKKSAIIYLLKSFCYEKETKMKLEEIKKTKYGLAYVLSSCAIILLSIIAIVVSCVKHTLWFMFVYLGFALLYAVCIFILEVLKGKEPAEEKPAKEEIKEEKVVEEDANEEELAEEPQKEERKEKPDKGNAVFVPFIQ